jgi:peptidoglycan/xylan/chitin deacetylase (PgdA/CDA1 family)
MAIKSTLTERIGFRAMEWSHHAVQLGISSAVVGAAVGGALFAAHWPASRLYGDALIAPARPDEIALTFDDGPNPRWTPMLLEILARHRVRATFFLIGKYAAMQKPLVRQMREAGHTIGNHSWSHPNFAFQSANRTRVELVRTQQELESILGEPVRLFRPPFGARRPYTLLCARSLGLTTVLWNAMAADWKATTIDQVAPRLTTLVERNHARGTASNVVLHDGGQHSLDVDRSASVAAAEALLARFGTERRFVSLDGWTEA